MGRYFIKRVALALLTLFFIMTLTFILMHVIPGDPFDAQNIQRAEIREAGSGLFASPVHLVDSGFSARAGARIDT